MAWWWLSLACSDPGGMSGGGSSSLSRPDFDLSDPVMVLEAASGKGEAAPIGRGDLDGDGTDDIGFLTSGNIATYEGALVVFSPYRSGTVNMSDGPVITVGLGSISGSEGPSDFDGDGYDDLLVQTKQSDGRVHIAAVIGPVVEDSTVSEPWMTGENLWLSGDFDGDGVGDVMVTSAGGESLLLRPLSPDPVTVQLEGSPSVATDLDGDGLDELVGWTSEGMAVWWTPEDGTHVVLGTPELSETDYSPMAGDLSGDGRDDLCVQDSAEIVCVLGPTPYDIAVEEWTTMSLAGTAYGWRIVPSTRAATGAQLVVQGADANSDDQPIAWLHTLQGGGVTHDVGWDARVIASDDAAITGVAAAGDLTGDSAGELVVTGYADPSHTPALFAFTGDLDWPLGTAE